MLKTEREAVRGEEGEEGTARESQKTCGPPSLGWEREKEKRERGERGKMGEKREGREVRCERGERNKILSGLWYAYQPQ